MSVLESLEVYSSKVDTGMMEKNGHDNNSSYYDDDIPPEMQPLLQRKYREKQEGGRSVYVSEGRVRIWMSE